MSKVDILRKACLKVIAMNIQEAQDKYGDKSIAESWACVRVLREALDTYSKQKGKNG